MDVRLIDLKRRLARWTLARPHVLLVDAPGTRRLRWQVEAELDRRHWPVALSPADTDLLLVLGEPGPQLAQAVDVLWSQTTRPRHRYDVRSGDDVARQLDSAAAALVAGATTLGPPPATARDLLEGGGAPGMEAAHDEHAGPDGPAGHDPGGHEGHHMDHGGDVAGLAMADTAPDRDGLTLDALRVSLGPVLPAWPTGLVVRGSLQGDVLTGVELSWADAATGGTEPAAAAEVLALDHLAQLLVVAGWPSAARRARAARSALLSDEPGRAARGRHEAAALTRRVRSSRTLAWSVRGLGQVPGSAPDGDQAGADVLARVHRWCAAAAVETTAEPAVSGRSPDGAAELLEGAELAAVRLIVASLVLDRAGVARAEASGV